MSTAVLPGREVPSTARGETPRFLEGLVEVVDAVETRLDAARGEAAARTETGPVEDDDIVEIRLEDGLTLWQSVAATRADFATAARGAADQALLVPRRVHLGPEATSRGVGGVLVEGVKVLRKKVAGAAGTLTALAVAEHIESQLDLGLHRCVRREAAEGTVIDLVSFDRDDVDPAQPMLILIHGTFSSTQGSFGDLVDPSAAPDDLWDALEAAFPGGIHALEHRSVSVSPLQNAVDLVEALPDGARVSLLSHSRGGLVAELVARQGLIDPETGAPRPDGPYDAIDRALLGEAGDGALLERLIAALADKRPTVERLIRFGGPLGGTTLASRRLDRTLSIALNALQLVHALRASVAYELLKSYLMGFVAAKNDRLPGLEAMMPDAALVRVVNRPDALSAGSLHVVTGDNEGKGLFRRLRNMALDHFFESDNDFVVNTPSMTRGLRRQAAPAVTAIVSDEITHFGYFRDPAGRGAIAGALRAAGGGAGEALLMDLEPDGIDVPRARGAESLPLCFYLPGVMGSHLDHDGRWIWSNPVLMATGGLEQLRMPGDGVAPRAMMDRYYGDLARYLASSHDMRLVPYDWRVDLLTTGRVLARMVREAMAGDTRPVRFLAHSMGGLVVRAMIETDPALWKEIRARPGSRVVMLGTPNSGAFSMAHTLMGRSRAIRQLATLDLTNSLEEVLEIVAGMPGPMQLLPADEGGRFLERTTWQELRRLDGGDWVVPPEDVLSRSREAHKLFRTQRLDPDRVHYVAGVGRDLTLTGIRTGASGTVQFLGTPEGDGTVTWRTGIPEGIEPYYMRAIHGDMARTAEAFPAIRDLLRTGHTTALPRMKPTISRRGAEAEPVVREAPLEVFPQAEDVLDSFVGAGVPVPEVDGSPRTRITVRHGDLRFTRNPVLVGHYLGDPIDGAEGTLDACLDGALTAVRDLNLYPGAIETGEVILRDGRNPGGAVVAGLGRFGELTPGQLSRTVNRAVLRYVLTCRRRAAEQDPPQGRMPDIALTTLVIGHKGANMTVQQSVQAILEAVAEANLTLGETPIAALEFVEVYEDTAFRAASAIHSACQTGPLAERFRFDDRIATREGAMLRMDYGLEDSDWQRITVARAGDGAEALNFTVIANGAKAHFEQATVDMAVIEELLRQSGKDTATDRDLGRVLYQLTIPLEMKAFAQSDQKIQLIVDEYTAKYPWELVEDAVSVLGDGLYQSASKTDFRPLVVRTPVLRQLVSPAPVRPRVEGNKALVVGIESVSGFAPLPGAREEGDAVARQLHGAGRFDVSHFHEETDAMAILSSVMRSDHKIMHFASHGVYRAEGDDARAGLILSEGVNLTSATLQNMEAVPEFVFLNCCHLGHIEERTGAVAADLSRTLIGKGVRAVVAAGWAVDDAAAKLFARVFYDSMLAGNAFGDAVFHARRAVFDRHPEKNTWGAYQCYGDPGYRLFARERDRGRGTRQRLFFSADHARKAALNIARAIDSSTRGREALAAELEALREATDPAWHEDAGWCEAMGWAYAKLNLHEPAIAFLEKAKASHRAAMAVASVERLEVLRVRQATTAWLDAERSQADGERVKALRAAQVEAIGAALEVFDNLDAVMGGRNEHREGLKGSMQKRLALGEKDRKAREAALRRMTGHYREAMALAAVDRPGRMKAQPSLNWISGLILLGEKEFDGEAVEVLLDRLLKQNAEAENGRPTFWTAALPAEVAVLRGILASASERSEILTEVSDAFRFAWRRGGAFGQASAIRDNVRFLRDTVAGRGSTERREWLDRVQAILAEVTEAEGTDRVDVA